MQPEFQPAFLSFSRIHSIVSGRLFHIFRRRSIGIAVIEIGREMVIVRLTGASIIW